MININAKIHTDGRKIVRCKTVSDVKKAIATGAIAHLIAGSIVIGVTDATATVWTSGTSAVTVWTSGTCTATVRTFGTSTATVVTYGASTALVESFESSTVTVRTFGTSAVTVETHGASTATVVTYGASVVTVESYGTSAVTVETYGTGVVTVRTYGASAVTVGTFESSTVTVESWNSENKLPQNINKIGNYEVATEQQGAVRIRQITDIVSKLPDALKMSTWHCGTPHSLAGWAVHLAGAAGKVMEADIGTASAGLVLLGREAQQHFYDSDGDARAWLAALKTQEKAQ